jgi:hypothetical protein
LEMCLVSLHDCCSPRAILFIRHTLFHNVAHTQETI